jgi:hypothetical protein
MKKREKKLVLHRETMRHLDLQSLRAEDLAHAKGNAAVAFGPQTSEGQPCCGCDTLLDTI